MNNKKHKYPEELVKAIREDEEYFLLIFKQLAIKRSNLLFLPKTCRNGDYKMLCPLHKERTPSFRVSIRIKNFKCFGCGCGGDAIKFFIKLHGEEKIHFLEAIKCLLEMKPVPRDYVPRGDPLQLRIPFKLYGWY